MGDQDPQPTQTSPLPRVRRGRGWPPSAPQGPLTCRGWTEGRPKPRPPRPLPFLGRGGGGCLLCLCMACTRYNVTVLSRAPPAAEANDPAVPVRTPAGPPGPPPSRAAEGSHRLPMQRGQAERLQCSAGAGPRKRPFWGGPVLPEHGESQAKSRGPCFKRPGPRIQLHFLKWPHGFGKDSQSPRHDMTSDRGENAEPVSSTLGSQAACDHGFTVCGNAHVSVSQGDQGGAEF